jgi:hypothetical protein
LLLVRDKVLMVGHDGGDGHGASYLGYGVHDDGESDIV